MYITSKISKSIRGFSIEMNGCFLGEILAILGEKSVYGYKTGINRWKPQWLLSYGVVIFSECTITSILLHPVVSRASACGIAAFKVAKIHIQPLCNS